MVVVVGGWGGGAVCSVYDHEISFYILDKGNPSVMEEVQKVFRLSSTSGFDPQNPIDRRERELTQTNRKGHDHDIRHSL